jgi:hypothetical protein
MADIFADRIERQRLLYEQLAAMPVVELTGVVGAGGAYGSKPRGQELWSLTLSFDAWRVDGGPMHTQALTARKEVTREDLKTFQSAIHAETVIAIRARVAEENVFGTPQALLEAFLHVDATDAELHGHLAQLQKPVIVEDDFFGVLTFDRRLGWYGGSAMWQGQAVELNLLPESRDDVALAFDAARALWASESSWSRRVRDFAVEQLLPLKNDNWLADDEVELTAEQFKSRMTLQTIEVGSDGSFVFWHDDGDLFWGHSIQICGSLSAGMTRADIPG